MTNLTQPRFNPPRRKTGKIALPAQVRERQIELAKAENARLLAEARARRASTLRS